MSIKIICIQVEEFLESAFFIEVIAKKGAFVWVNHHGSLVWADLLAFSLHDDTSPWQLLTDYHSNTLLMSQNL